MKYEEYETAVITIKAIRKYIKQAYDDAEAKHDNYGEFYMDDSLYEIMKETETLLSKIDKIITQFEKRR